MSTKSNIIELNGRKYDIATGKPVNSAQTSSQTKSKPRHIDGFVKPSDTSRLAPMKPAPQKEPVKLQPSTPSKTMKSFDIQRTTGGSKPHRSLQHSKTLMRKSVHEPEASAKRHIKANIRTDALAKQPTLVIEPKSSANNVDDGRLKRASKISKNKLISRFGTVHLENSTYVSTNHTDDAIEAHSVTLEHSQTVVEPTHTVNVQSGQRPVSTHTDDVFEQALRHANSHASKQTGHAKSKTKKHRRSKVGFKLTGLAASGLAVIVLAGFIVYQNATNIQLHLASSKAGINATLPAWKPDGYKADKVSYSPGNVAISYNNGSSEGFNLIQTQSNWDSQALLDDFVAAADGSYNTVKSGGRTIYTYGNNDATWVNGGIWYRLDTNGTLSTSQLVQLASSI